MNILVLSWRDPKHPLSGGAEQVMHEHMKGWIGAGHKVTLFSSKVDTLPNEEVIDDVHIVRRGYKYLGVQVAAFFWYLFGKHESFSLVIDEFHGIPFFTPLYVSEPKLAVIQEMAREVWLKNPLTWPINLIVGTIGYILEPLVFHLYKHSLLPGSRNINFMTGSESAKAELIKVGINKKYISVVPHGSLIKYPPTKIRKERVPTVIYLGALSKDKGIEDAIKCFKILNELGNYQFWVIGNAETPEYEKKVKSLSIRFGLENKIKFWGGKDKVNDAKKFELLRRSHIMVNPSIREGWGLVNIEANAMGTPVVAYNSPGLVDSVGKGRGGIICSVNSPECLANEIKLLFDDKSRYKKMVDEAILWSKKFSWEKSKSMSLTLIENVVKLNSL